MSDRVAGEVSLREAGRVTPGQPVAIIESLRDGNWHVGEELRLLAARVSALRPRRGLPRRGRGGRGGSCFALTSALPGEGKSTVALGLASALAREPGRRVMLIEADLRRPSIRRALELEPLPGLAEYLGGSTAEVETRVVEPGGFSLVVAGEVPVTEPEVLGSARMSALLRLARDHHDVVLVDAPPLLPVVDPILIQDMVDGFLMVVRSRVTPRLAVNEAFAKLGSGAVLGVVLNDHQEERGSYRRYAYERYGGKDGAPATRSRLR